MATARTFKLSEDINLNLGNKNISQSVSQSVAIYLVDVLKENKHKLGQLKGQVKKFNINEKKIFYINKETAKNRLRSTSQAATLGSYCSNFSW